MSEPSDSPSLFETAAAASTGESPSSDSLVVVVSTRFCTSVVIGVMTPDPAGALSVPTKGSPVEISIPPRETSGTSGSNNALLKAPSLSVVMTISPLSRSPFPFASPNTVAPEIYPSTTKAVSTAAGGVSPPPLPPAMPPSTAAPPSPASRAPPPTSPAPPASAISKIASAVDDDTNTSPFSVKVTSSAGIRTSPPEAMVRTTSPLASITAETTPSMVFTSTRPSCPIAGMVIGNSSVAAPRPDKRRWALRAAQDLMNFRRTSAR